MDLPRRMIDVSILLGVESLTYPGDPPYRLQAVATHGDGAGCHLSRIEMSLHCGTHLDAPLHFIPGGDAIERFGLSDFLLPACVADLCGRAVIAAPDLDGLDVAAGEALLFKTDNSVTGRCRSGRFDEEFVRLTPEAARRCVDLRLRMVGIDYLSVELSRDRTYPVHRTLLAGGVLILEGLDLAGASAGRHVLSCFPLRIHGAEASPVRAVLMR